MGGTGMFKRISRDFRRVPGIEREVLGVFQGFSGGLRGIPNLFKGVTGKI